MSYLLAARQSRLGRGGRMGLVPILRTGTGISDMVPFRFPNGVSSPISESPIIVRQISVTPTPTATPSPSPTPIAPISDMVPVRFPSGVTSPIGSPIIVRQISVTPTPVSTPVPSPTPIAPISDMVPVRFPSGISSPIGSPIISRPIYALPSPTPSPSPTPVAPIIVRPISSGTVATTPTANAGTPVPAGYPTSQIFVDASGAFWQYSASQNHWINVGTPYNTGAAYVPPAVPTGSTPSAPTSLATPTTAPAPVSTINIAAPSSSTYQDILNWLEEDTLGATIGFSSIPNWIIVAGAGALAWKFSQHGGKR